MNSLKPIYWHQGLFLKPHHFQYIHAYLHEESLTLKKAIKPYFWGVSKLNINKQELLNKNFQIDDLEIIFLDGSTINVPKSAVVASRTFNEIYDNSDSDKDIQVYIAIKSFNENSVNVTDLNSYDNLENIHTRFVSKNETKPVQNLYHDDEVADIQFMDYFLKIFFDDEVNNLNGYQIIPIAKIKKQSDQVHLSTNFSPPLLNINADDNFFEIIKDIQKDLVSHVLQLEEYKLPSEDTTHELNYLKYLIALQSLSNYTPKLNNMIKTPGIHPWDYYELFIQLVGILSTFSNRVNVFGKLSSDKYLIKEYDHLNLYECFYELKQLIEELLNSIIIGPEFILEFTKDNTTFSLDCPISIFKAKYRYFLVVKTPTNENSLEDSFKNFAKIASASEIETIVDRSLSGLAFERYNRAIQGLPQRSSSHFYELETDEQQSHWINIQQTLNMTIEFEDALDDTSIELIVLTK